MERNSLNIIALGTLMIGCGIYAGPLAQEVQESNERDAEKKACGERALAEFNQDQEIKHGLERFFQNSNAMTLNVSLASYTRGYLKGEQNSEARIRALLAENDALKTEKTNLLAQLAALQARLDKDASAGEKPAADVTILPADLKNQGERSEGTPTLDAGAKAEGSAA